MVSFQELTILTKAGVYQATRCGQDLLFIRKLCGAKLVGPVHWSDRVISFSLLRPVVVHTPHVQDFQNCRSFSQTKATSGSDIPTYPGKHRCDADRASARGHSGA